MHLIKILGWLILVIGIVIVLQPERVTGKPVPADTYDAIERRIWWGAIIGLGLLLLIHNQLTPWLATAVAVLMFLLAGLLCARFAGLALDGVVAKQWVLVAIEAVVFLPLVWWYSRLRGWV